MTCSQCGGEIELTDPHTGYGMCGCCLHDALRSGWNPEPDEPFSVPVPGALP